MDYQKEIQKCYRDNPNTSGLEILNQLQLTDKRSVKVFWRELEKYQISRRGNYPGIRRNTNAHAKSKRRGQTYWIPPKEIE